MWTGLPSYDEGNVPQFVSQAVPLVIAGQRQSARLTAAYIQIAARRPVSIDLAQISTRNGADPREVYRRPFVTVWTALKAGSEFDAAIAAGLARATSTAATDVQLAHRAAYGEIQRADPAIRGYRRAADGGACDFCRLIDGAFVKSADAMSLHSHCGCGLEPVIDERPSIDPLPEGVAVHEHGELGSVLGDPAHSFDDLS